MLMHLFFAGVLLRLRTGSWLVIFQTYHLLRWILFPMVLLHLIFTPGEVLFHHGPSYEGVYAAVWYALHLSVIFLSGLLLSRSLTLKEWLVLFGYMPWVGKKLHVLLQLMWPMYLDFKQRLMLFRMQWQLKRQWRYFPTALLAVMIHVLAHGRVHAQQVWLRWDGAIDSPKIQLDVYEMQLILLSFLWCYLLWTS